MSPALKNFYAERRNKKLKFALYSLGAIIGMYAIWSVAKMDYCEIWYSVPCF